MTTTEAVQLLGKSKQWLYLQARKAKIRKTLSPTGDTDWNEQDVVRMRVLLDYGVEKDWDWAKQYTAIYCRTEPVSDLPPANQRLQAQKDRMIKFAAGRDLQPDIILGEVRPVLRYGTLATNSAKDATPNALQSLAGLIGHGKIKTLIIETRDRLVACDSWLLMETFLRIFGCEVVVANELWPTQEQRAESKGWMADLLARYKVLSGEIRDQSIVDIFMKGFDPKATFLATAKIEAKLTQREKEKRKPAWAKLPAEKRILDLDDAWSPGTT